MPHRRTAKASAPSVRVDRQPVRLLLVDAETAPADAVVEALRGEPAVVAQARSLAEARGQIQRDRVDVLLVAAKLPDGNGLDLVRELPRLGASATQTIVLSDTRSFNNAVAALRTGAGDLILKPVDHDELRDRLQDAIARFRHERRRRRHYRRLRKTCRSLSAARKDVNQQVDVLCKDLVVAYQELAGQMQQVVYTSEFAALIRQELDLEPLLRRVLEYLVEKAGPTNAAIFLPASADEYTLGGYVNYDQVGGSPDLLLEHLADAAVPTLAEHDGLLHLTDDASVSDWLGDDAAYLSDCHVACCTGVHDEEALVVLMLFRDGNEPFSENALEALAAITPLLADHLARIIRIHHRHMPDEVEDGGAYGNAA